VCQRWRQLIFAFPDHLNVRLCCGKEKPVKETLRIWPALPIVLLDNTCDWDIDDGEPEDGVLVALEQSNRVYEISLDFFPNYNPLGTIVSAMLVSFPALEHLSLMACDVRLPVFPDAFLGGSAPRLQSLNLHGIPYPALPNLLLSARGLVDLSLTDIPRSGTFLPEVIVNHMTGLPRLETLTLKFRSRRSCPVPESRSPPAARAVFPTLRRLYFEGIPEYLDDLISRIDAPLILDLDVSFFNQPFVTSDFCQLRQFIDRAENFKSLTHALINFRHCAAVVSLLQRTQTYNATLSVGILCKDLHPQLWSLAQVANASLLPLFKVESLEVSSERQGWLFHPEHAEEDARWLNVLQPFSAVKNLYPHKNTISSLAYALKEVPEEQLSEVLPALQGLSMDEPRSPGFAGPLPPAVQEAIERFIAIRRLSTSWIPDRMHYWHMRS
jgi:hypothetical protein